MPWGSSSGRDRGPRDPRFRSDLAHDLDERANLLALLGRPREAEALLLRARDVSGRLASDFPSFMEYQNLHSTVRRDLAILQRNRGQAQDAQRDLERAIAVSESLVRRNPDMPNYRRTLAVHHANLGDLLHTAGRPVEAEREYREALRLAEALAAEQPGLLDYRALRALYRSSMAFLFRVTGRFLEAESAYENVVAELEALLQEFPGLPHLRASLASACNQRGAVLDLLKRPREAEASLDAGHRPGGRACGRDPRRAVLSRHRRPGPRLACARSLDRQGDRPGPPVQRAGDPPHGVLLATDPESNSHRFLCGPPPPSPRLQAREGDGRAAEASARRIEDLPRSSIEHYNASCFLSLILGAVRGGKLPEAERDALAAVPRRPLDGSTHQGDRQGLQEHWPDEEGSRPGPDPLAGGFPGPCSIGSRRRWRRKVTLHPFDDRVARGTTSPGRSSLVRRHEAEAER